MNKFRIGSLDYSPYNNRDLKHQEFLNELLDEVEEMGELENRLGDITYMFDHSYQEISGFSLDNPNAYLISDENKIIGFVYMYLNKLNEVLLYLGIHKDYRKMGYGSCVTKELSDYLLRCFPIKGVRVQVESDNIGSLKSIMRAGFQHLEDDFYIKR